MINTQDLHIEEEIKPLFDLTYNPYSGAEVKDILTKTLPSKEAIFARQELLKGFIANREILKDYSYYRSTSPKYMSSWRLFLLGLYPQATCD
jgi:DNA mismatch repair protein MutS